MGKLIIAFIGNYIHDGGWSLTLSGYIVTISKGNDVFIHDLSGLWISKGAVADIMHRFYEWKARVDLRRSEAK